MKENEIWDLKKSIAEFIHPRLEEFKNWVVENKMIAIPTWIQEESPDIAMDDIQLKQAWINVLDEMLEGFKYYAGCKVGEDQESVDKKKNRSLELFCKYYDHLWD